MSKLHQITEEDLTTLERSLPEIMDAMLLQLDNRLRVKFRSIQKILSDVRWGYGPPTNVEKIDASAEGSGDYPS